MNKENGVGYTNNLGKEITRLGKKNRSEIYLFIFKNFNLTAYEAILGHNEFFYFLLRVQQTQFLIKLGYQSYVHDKIIPLCGD